MATADLTAQRLRELLHYDHETGVLRWLVTRGKARAGAVAGNPNRGYLQLRVDGVTTNAHRVAWLYTYGVWPTNYIDHIDGNPTNNRISNLRDVSQSINMQNEKQARANSLSGLLGVTRKRRRWRAEITVNGKSKWLGVFDSPELAHSAYLEAKRRLHIGCTI